MPESHLRRMAYYGESCYSKSQSQNSWSQQYPCFQASYGVLSSEPCDGGWRPLEELRQNWVLACGAPMNRQDKIGCRPLVVFEGGDFDFSFSPHLSSETAPREDRDVSGSGLSAAEGFFVGRANGVVGAAAAEEAGLRGEVFFAGIGGNFFGRGFRFGRLFWGF